MTIVVLAIAGLILALPALLMRGDETVTRLVWRQILNPRNQEAYELLARYAAAQETAAAYMRTSADEQRLRGDPDAAAVLDRASRDFTAAALEARSRLAFLQRIRWAAGA